MYKLYLAEANAKKLSILLRHCCCCCFDFQNCTRQGQEGSDTIYGEDGNDDIYGGHNKRFGSDSGDILDGGPGEDVILGMQTRVRFALLLCISALIVNTYIFPLIFVLIKAIMDRLYARYWGMTGEC